MSGKGEEEVGGGCEPTIFEEGDSKNLKVGFRVISNILGNVPPCPNKKIESWISGQSDIGQCTTPSIFFIVFGLKQHWTILSPWMMYHPQQNFFPIFGSKQHWTILDPGGCTPCPAEFFFHVFGSK